MVILNVIPSTDNIKFGPKTKSYKMILFAVIATN